jgi:hypothetical protein
MHTVRQLSVGQPLQSLKLRPLLSMNFREVEQGTGAEQAMLLDGRPVGSLSKVKDLGW